MDGNNTNLGQSAGTMTLTDDATGKSIKLPVIEGSIGPKVIDVRKLYAQTGYFTYDPGFMATAACRSSITYIDGDDGILLDLGYAENFLHMCFAVPCEEYKVSPTLARAMDQIFILHADHEQNASTATVRNAGSSGANPFACIAAGIASLWGPAHGGANEAVLKMLARIGDKKNIPDFVQHVKDKNEHEIQYGFGHRVYKNYDPRARVLRESCHEVLDELGIKDEPLLEIALELEKISLNDDYFISRKLYPNVDFYSGIILKAMGFPTSMFTVLFAVARTVGWVAQWTEMNEDSQATLMRPRELFIGAPERHYVPIDQRR